MLNAPRRHLAACRGFSVLELMIGLTVLGLLVGVAAPSLQEWISNTRVRTVADSLQNGLRLAQSEAVRQSRQVVFTLTNATPGENAVPAANGRNWSIQTVPLLAGAENVRFVQGGALTDVASGVTIGGPMAICFNSVGALTANAAPGPTGAACTVNPGSPTQTYAVARTGSDRPLRVSVSIGGRVRMCDPMRLVANSPDGC